MKFKDMIEPGQKGQLRYTAQLCCSPAELLLLSRFVSARETVAFCRPQPSRFWQFWWKLAAFGKSGYVNPTTRERLAEYSSTGVIGHAIYEKIWSLTSRRRIRVDDILRGFTITAKQDTLERLRKDIHDYVAEIERRVAFRS